MTESTFWPTYSFHDLKTKHLNRRGILMHIHIPIVSWFLVTLVMSPSFVDTHFPCGACGGDITVLRIQAEQEEAKTREDTKIKALEGELAWNLSIQQLFFWKLVKIILIFCFQDSSEMAMKLGNFSDWDPWIQLELNGRVLIHNSPREHNHPASHPRLRIVSWPRRGWINDVSGVGVGWEVLVVRKKRNEKCL